jgi:hypothetical protein
MEGRPVVAACECRVGGERDVAENWLGEFSVVLGNRAAVCLRNTYCMCLSAIWIVWHHALRYFVIQGLCLCLWPTVVYINTVCMCLCLCVWSVYEACVVKERRNCILEYREGKCSWITLPLRQLSIMIFEVRCVAENFEVLHIGRFLFHTKLHTC